MAKKAVKKKIAAKKSVKNTPVKKATSTKKKVTVKKEAVKKAPVKKASPAKEKVITKKKAVKEVIIKTVPVKKEEPKKVTKRRKPIKKPVTKRSSNIVNTKLSASQEKMIVEYKTPSISKPLGSAPLPHINTDTRTRYTDKELTEFKALIMKKLGEAQKDLELLKNTLSHKDDHGTDDTSPSFKLLEDGSDVLSKEETAHLASRQEKFIQNLQNALIRIANKTYGICRVTGKLIAKERLRSVPHATLAIQAKLGERRR